MEEKNCLKFGVDRAQMTKFSAIRGRKGETLFCPGGQLLIIAVSFVPGHHYPKSMEEMLVLCRYLESLHQKGLVHGDIRLFNMVFGPEKIQLIDFDFAGENGIVEYPPNYEHKLSDGFGRRNVGKKFGRKITMTDDWNAMIATFIVPFQFRTHDPATLVKLNDFIQILQTGKNKDHFMAELTQLAECKEEIKVYVRDRDLMVELDRGTKVLEEHRAMSLGTKDGDQVSP